MLEVLVNVLGWHNVSQALMHKDEAKAFSRANPILVSHTCKTLSDKWKQGKAREYLESLPTDLQHCLICNLAGDISAEILAEYGLSEI